MPSLLELADPEGRDQEYVFYAQLLKARIEADGSSNLGRTLGHGGSGRRRRSGADALGGRLLHIGALQAAEGP